MPAPTPCAETVALARRLIVVKAKLRAVSHETCHLLPEIQDWAASDDVAGKGLYQIDTGLERYQVADAVRHLEEAHMILCSVHKSLKKTCEDNTIPIPPDPTPQGGGGR